MAKVASKKVQSNSPWIPMEQFVPSIQYTFVILFMLYTTKLHANLNFFLYLLQNIFLGEDIRKQLPRESAEFDGVNASWKEIMTRMNKDNNALRGTHHEGI